MEKQVIPWTEGTAGVNNRRPWALKLRITTEQRFSMDSVMFGIVVFGRKVSEPWIPNCSV